MNYFNKETTVMYQHGGTAGLGVLTNHQNSNSTGAAIPQRRLEGCLKRFEHLLSCYADIANQAEALASSIAGPTSEPNQAAIATPPPTALIGQLEGIADQFDGRMQRIQSALRRLQEL